MQTEFVETYRTLRDNPQMFGGDSSRCALEKIQQFTAPSKALIKRVERHRKALPFVDQPKTGKLSQKAIDGRMCNEFFKMQKAMLGGTRTVAAHTEAVVPPVKKAWTYIEPQAKRELYPDAKPLAMPAPDRRRDHLIALGRAGIEVDMFRVLEVFSSFNSYSEAVRNA